MIRQVKRAAEHWLKACGMHSRVTLLYLMTASAASGAVVDFRLTNLSTPSGSDTAATVPTSLSSFAIGSSIFLEVWVQTTNTNGLSSASLDLLFDSSLATAVSVTHSSIFPTLTHSSVDNPSGVIDELSGSHLGPCTDAIAVAPQWARVAVVEFTADADGPLSIQAAATGSLVYGTALCGLGDVDPADIGFGSVAATVGGAAIPAASTWGLVAMSLSILVAGTIVLRRVGPTQELTAATGR